MSSKSKNITTYRTRVGKIPGKQYQAVEWTARNTYNSIAKKSKRNPYVRSRYFAGEKVFLKLFWEHLNQKSRFERKRRLKFYNCAIELLEKSSCIPSIMQNPSKQSETLYRFSGVTPTDEFFYVQVKKDKKSGKFFMSVFPAR